MQVLVRRLSSTHNTLFAHHKIVGKPIFTVETNLLSCSDPKSLSLIPTSVGVGHGDKLCGRAGAARAGSLFLLLRLRCSVVRVLGGGRRHRALCRPTDRRDSQCALLGLKLLLTRSLSLTHTALGAKVQENCKISDRLRCKWH